MNFRHSHLKLSAGFRWLFATLLAAVLSFTFAPTRPALAVCDPDVVMTRISLASDGAQGNGDSIYLDISGDGRFVTYWSQATNLGNPPGGNIFVYDRDSCQSTGVSVQLNGTPASASTFPTISADGRFVAFSSVNNNLVSGDTGDEDVFVRDLQTSQTILVSLSSSGVKGNSFSWLPFISSDGNYVIFTSFATNLTANCTNGKAHIYVRDRQANQTTCVSVGSGGIQGNADSNRGSISADGRYVVFYSAASNLVAGDIDNGPAYTNDVFLHDRQTGQTTSISVDSFNTQVGDHSGIELEISADGRYVVFESTSSQLVANDTNNTDDVFVRDLQTGQTNRISINSGSEQGNGASFAASISADGRYASFVSTAGNLVPDDTNTCGQFYLTPGTCPDFFVHDRLTGGVVRASLSGSGTQTSQQTNYQIFSQAISADGSYIAFSTNVSDLVSGDTNNKKDIFLVRLLVPPPPTILVVNSADDADNGVCSSAHCSLREAIKAANELPDTNTITFNINGGDLQTIQPTTPLPIVSNSVIIDGTTQPGYAVGAPVIVLNGANVVSPLPEAKVGINIVGASNSTVRGLVLNGWSYGGVGILNGDNNVIEGNFIGTNAAGTAAVPNLYGVIIYNGSNNRVGGTTVAQRNIISGNNDDGVNIGGLTSAQAVANLVQGNYIGTNAAGTTALGNGDDGVKVEIADATVIGGTTTGARNIIAASNNNGVILKGANTINSLIQGNFIGTDVTGTVSLGNDLAGVHIEGALNNTVGGTVAAARNILSGNDFYGVFVDSNAAQNIIQGNYIGTDSTGTVALAPQSAGVSLSGSNNTLGGTVSGARNIISGNVEGVGVLGNGNTIQGNYIGTDVSGTLDVGNTAWGIEMVGTPANNMIGGTLPGAGNIIAYNGSTGIWFHGSGGTGNAILGNIIFSNLGIGINLSLSHVGDGVTLNDANDTDTGPNNLQNFPLLTNVSVTASGTTIMGVLNTESNKAYRLEFFASPLCDPQYYREGRSYLGFTNVVTNGDGNVTFSANLSALTSNGQFITATATDPNNNTSEFSACVPVVVISPPVAAPTRNYSTTSSVSLSWQGVTWALGYEIEVDDNNNFSSPEYVNRSLTAPAQSDTTTPLPDDVYYWRVGAKKPDGTIAWSTVQSFTVDVP